MNHKLWSMESLLRIWKQAEYRKTFFQTGLKLIEESLAHLSDTYERIVIEGAGPAEINLKERELVNMRVAKILMLLLY